MMLRALIVLTLGTVSTGCGWVQQTQLQKHLAEVQKTHAADIAECEHLYPDKYRKPATKRIKCFNEVCQRRREIASAGRSKSPSRRRQQGPDIGALLLSRFSREDWPRARRLAEAGVIDAWSG
jgi:hypothetical protein